MTVYVIYIKWTCRPCAISPDHTDPTSGFGVSLMYISAVVMFRSAFYGAVVAEVDADHAMTERLVRWMGRQSLEYTYAEMSIQPYKKLDTTDLYKE